MDLLKDLIHQQKEGVQALTKEKKWFRRKGLSEKEENEALQAILTEKERQKERELRQLEQLNDFLDAKKRGRSETTGDAKLPDSPPSKQLRTKATESEASDITTEKDVPIPNEVVVSKLRRRNQVVTYFGESDWQRYRRMCKLEIEEHEDELAGGQQNVFLRLLEDGSSKSVGSEDDRRHLASHRNEDFDEDDDLIKNEKSQSVDQSKEAIICQWIRRMLSEWENELDERTSEEKRSTLGKIKTAQCKLTRKDLRPLMKKLKQHQVEAAVLDKLHAMVTLCETQEYTKAHDKYIELSIGNAAWPMGVTMVGIHERAGRSKIFTSEIAHILNDESTRKYIHMFKRLLSFCQRKYPTDPSKMVTISTSHI